MSFSIQHYLHLVQSYDNQAQRLKRIFHEINAQVKYSKQQAYLEALKNDTFRIAVVGEFGRGKSMFINALLGEKVLPSSPLITTTVLNHITYGEERKVKLNFHDGSEKIISQEEFQLLVAPMEPIKGNKESEREYKEAVSYIQSIAYADVQHPVSFCKNGVSIIDTPGLNDGNETRDRIASEIIPRSDVAIILLTAKAPLSASELTMLKDRLLENDIQKVFIVVNFKDALRTEEDRNEVMHYIKDNLKDLFVHPKVYLVSAKQGLATKRVGNGEELRVRKPVSLEETGLPEFETALSEFLQYDRGKVKLKRPLHQSIRLIEDTLEKEIPLVKNSLQQQSVGIEEKVMEVKEQLVAFKKDGQETLGRIERLLQTKEHDLVRWYKEELEDIRREALHTFESEVSMEGVEAKIDRLLARRDRKLYTEKVQRMKNLTKQVVDLGSKSLNAQWNGVEGAVQELVPSNTTTDMLPFTIQNHSYDIFREIYHELDTAWDKSTGWLGKFFIGTGYVINTLFAGIAGLFGKSEVDKRKESRRKLSSDLSHRNKSKTEAMKEEWQTVIHGTTSNYQKVVHQQAQEMEEYLKTIQDNAHLEKGEIERRMQVVEGQERSLNEIKEELLTLDQHIESGRREALV